MTKAPILALIVDSEPLACEKVRQMVRHDPEIEVIGECANGREAVAAIQQSAPDLLFLDVQMPEVGGFEVLEALGAERMPLVIFTTAYDRYAVQAFEVRSLNYLLKPFDRERFEAVMQRAKSQIKSRRNGSCGRRALTLLEELKTRSEQLERLALKTSGSIFLRNMEEQRLTLTWGY